MLPAKAMVLNGLDAHSINEMKKDIMVWLWNNQISTFTSPRSQMFGNPHYMKEESVWNIQY